MISLITRTLLWPSLWGDVMTFVKSCESCQCTKIDTQASQGSLMPFEILDRPWIVIGTELIVKLQLSSRFESLLVIVKHFLKGAHFIPCKENMDSSALASLFISHFFWYHGLPNKIVTDHGPTFVSAFWSTVQKALRICSAPSTAYHPQTNGQTERTNRTLVTYLCHFCSHQQDDWSDWLPIAEFSFNNSTSSSTKLSPFFSWQGFHAQANSSTTPSKVPTADAYVALLEDIQLTLGESFLHLKEVQSRFYDSHSCPSCICPQQTCLAFTSF